MADYRALVRNGAVNQVQADADSVIVGAGIKTSTGNLTITPSGTNIIIPASKLLTTSGSGNINLPNNGSARFQIETTAVSANVTAANLGTLTAGPASNADALHTHSGSGGGSKICMLLSGFKQTLAGNTGYAIMGGNVYVSAEHAGVTVKLRVVGFSADNVTAVRCQLYNLTTGAYVTGLGAGPVDYITITSANGELVESLDILANLSNNNLYQFRVTPTSSATRGGIYYAALIGA